MATGRTVKKYTRTYVDGYDLSGDFGSVGDLTEIYESEADAGLNWEVKGTLNGVLSANCGPFNGIFNSNPTGIHAVGAGTFITPAARNVMVPIGIRAIPAMGDPVFCGIFEQLKYAFDPGKNLSLVSMAFGNLDSTGAMNYQRLWGTLLHPAGNETAVNSSNGVADELGVQTTKGGWLMYQIFGYTGTGSVVLKVQDATTIGGAYSDIAGLATGSIAHTSMPCGGIIQIANTATIRAFTRWQFVLTTLTGLNFALAFMRGN